MLIGRARVLREHSAQCVQLFRREARREHVRYLHGERALPFAGGEAAERARRGVRVGDVGLDVENGRAVHQVGAGNAQHGPFGRGELHGLQLHAGEAEGIRPHGRARGENAHARVPAQARRAHQRRPGLAKILRKSPDEPEVGKALYAPQRVPLAETGLENDFGPQLRHDAALARDAEFAAEVAAHAGDGGDDDAVGHDGASFEVFEHIIMSAGRKGKRCACARAGEGV